VCVSARARVCRDVEVQDAVLPVVEIESQSRSLGEVVKCARVPGWGLSQRWGERTGQGGGWRAGVDTLSPHHEPCSNVFLHNVGTCTLDLPLSSWVTKVSVPINIVIIIISLP
jgi:hypothetical protein